MFTTIKRSNQQIAALKSQLEQSSNDIDAITQNLAYIEFSPTGSVIFANGQSKIGRVVHLEATYNPIFDDCKRVIEVIKIAVDITQKVNVADEVRSLSKRTSQSTEEISALISKTQAVAASISELIGEIEHLSAESQSYVSHVEDAMKDIKVGADNVVAQISQVLAQNKK